MLMLGGSVSSMFLARLRSASEVRPPKLLGRKVMRLSDASSNSRKGYDVPMASGSFFNLFWLIFKYVSDASARIGCEITSTLLRDMSRDCRTDPSW